MTGFLDIASTASVKAAQHANGSAEFCARLRGTRAFDHFTEAEAQFIAQRDSFYMATVSETGWPYVQHRGGPAGFLRVLDDQTLGFADFRGNRQYISVGNLSADDRVSLVLVDYGNRCRLKIYAHAEARDLSADPALAGRLVTDGYAAKPERALLLHLEAFDWNCPQHITPRFSAAELERVLQPVRLRLEQLETENVILRQSSRARMENDRKPPVIALRIARPSDDLEGLLRFYRDGLGLTVLDRFADHDGFDGLMLGQEGAPYHFEFTKKQGHLAGHAPTQDNLLVFYYPDVTEWRAAVQRMRDAGLASVGSFNPYWDRNGQTFEDPDGYRIVLQNAAWDR